MSFNLASSIGEKILVLLLQEQHMDKTQARALVARFVTDSCTREDMRLIRTVAKKNSASTWNSLKTMIAALDTVRSGEVFVQDKKSTKRVSVKTTHKDTAYVRAASAHKAECHPRGGFVKGSGLHYERE